MKNLNSMVFILLQKFSVNTRQRIKNSFPNYGPKNIAFNTNKLSPQALKITIFTILRFKPAFSCLIYDEVALRQNFLIILATQHKLL